MPCRTKVSRDFMTNPWAPQVFSPAQMLPIFDYIFTRSLPPGADPFRGYHGMVELVGVSLPWAVFKKRAGPFVADPPPPPPPRPPVPVVLPPPAPAVPAVVPITKGATSGAARPRTPFDVRKLVTPAGSAKAPVEKVRR